MLLNLGSPSNLYNRAIFFFAHSIFPTETIGEEYISSTSDV